LLEFFRLSHRRQINEAVIHREQLLLIPNVADRKRLLLQLLQKNNVTLRCGHKPLAAPIATISLNNLFLQKDLLHQRYVGQGSDQTRIGLSGGDCTCFRAHLCLLLFCIGDTKQKHAGRAMTKALFLLRFTATKP
jgi:hypothetical protein